GALTGAQAALGVLLTGDVGGGVRLVTGQGGLVLLLLQLLLSFLVGGRHQATSSSTPWERTISREVSERSRSAVWGPGAPRLPWSSTRIRSAAVMVVTRWATITISASRVSGASAARSRASVVRSRALKESSNRYSE